MTRILTTSRFFSRSLFPRWYEKAGLLGGSVKLPISALDEVQKGDRI
jgi:hypothetical protein